MDPDTGYFLLIVFGLPVLLMLLTGPAMWSEKWGWRALDRVEQLFMRAIDDEDTTGVKPPSGQSPRRRR